MIVLRNKSGSERERSGRICVLVGCGMGNDESMGGTRGRKEEPGAKKREVNARDGGNRPGEAAVVLLGLSESSILRS